MQTKTLSREAYYGYCHEIYEYMALYSPSALERERGLRICRVIRQVLETIQGEQACLS